MGVNGVETAVVTGANSGVGLALCERLLTTYPKVKLCMVCRSKLRGESAKEALRLSHPGADITLILGDVGSLSSVKETVIEISKKFSHIDFLFLNAGIMNSPKLDFGAVVSTFFQPSKLVHRFTTAAGLLKISDGTTEEGFKLTFATNVLGHFSMVEEMEKLGLLGGVAPSRVIWTSSRAASKDVFSIADIQHTKGIDPYAASKYLSDTLSVAMNEKLRPKNITTNTYCPGTVLSGLSFGILPQWLWYLLLPFFKLLRIIVPSFTLDPYHGVEAAMWLIKEDPAKLDPMDKYYSCCDVFGNAYSLNKKMDVSLDEGEAAYQQLRQLIRNCQSSI